MTIPAIKFEIICEYKNFQIGIESECLGGFCGPVGTLKIQHISHAFRDLKSSDCAHLAKITNVILELFEKNKIENSLMYGRQDRFPESSNPDVAKKWKPASLEIIPYPTVGYVKRLYRKILVAIHVIFGSAKLNDKQFETIKNFYESQNLLEKLNIKINDDELIEVVPDPLTDIEPHLDVFCQKRKNDEQCIKEVNTGGISYMFWQDKCPKVVDLEKDNHVLIIPVGEKGHLDGSSIPLKQRTGIFENVQKIMLLYRRFKYETMIYIERNGKDLRGQMHQHAHVQGITHFPSTLWQKIQLAVHIAWTPKLTLDQMKDRIDKLKVYL